MYNYLRTYQNFIFEVVSGASYNVICKAKVFITAIVIALGCLMPTISIAERGIAVTPVTPFGTQATGHQWLFVVGIDWYIHWSRLKTAVNDAISLRDVPVYRYHFGTKAVDRIETFA